MAIEAGITQDAMTIADAIHDYAKSKQWIENDYHIFMTGNSDFYTLRILVVATAYEGRTEQQEYRDFDDVMDVIESRAKPSLRAINSYGLALRGKNDFAFYPAPRLDPGEFEVDEKLINFGVSWSEPFRSRAYPSAHGAE
jgi:hypothetical protein